MDIASLLGSYCFPIVACIAMGWYVNDVTKNNRQDMKEMQEKHTEEMKEFKDQVTEALNNNTIAITRLCEKVERKEVKLNGSDD